MTLDAFLHVGTDIAVAIITKPVTFEPVETLTSDPKHQTILNTVLQWARKRNTTLRFQ